MSKLVTRVYLPLLLLIGGSLFFLFSSADMQWARSFYHPSEGWKDADLQPWKGLYQYGVLPALGLVLVAVVVLILGIGHPLRKYRKIALYLLSCMALGPGLIANALLKGFWGRPRPKQLQEFGGSFEYEPLLTIDLTSFGKSFPCGHATMGFYFYSLGFVLLPFYPKLARLTGLFATVFGLLIGLARLAQGGHFPSDTLWAGGICWFVSLGLAHLYRLEEAPLMSTAHLRKRRWWVLPALGGGLAAVTFVVALATPYQKTSSLHVPELEGITRVQVNVPGSLSVIRAEELKLRSEGYGHRLPKSRHRLIMRREKDLLHFDLRKRGIFTELILTNELHLPEGIVLQEGEEP